MILSTCTELFAVLLIQVSAHVIFTTLFFKQGEYHCGLDKPNHSLVSLLSCFMTSNRLSLEIEILEQSHGKSTSNQLHLTRLCLETENTCIFLLRRDKLSN